MSRFSRPLLIAFGLLCLTGCAGSRVRFLATGAVPDNASDMTLVTFHSAIETRGLQRRQLVYSVRLLDQYNEPIPSRDERFRDVDGNVAASKTIVVIRSPWTFDDVKVTIPVPELEIRASSPPRWVEYSFGFADGTRLATKVDVFDERITRRVLAKQGVSLDAFAARREDVPAPSSTVPDEPNRSRASADDSDDSLRAPLVRAPESTRSADQPTAPDTRKERAALSPLSERPVGYRRARTHRVLERDTLESLALLHYGRAADWTHIARANGSLDSATLVPGQIIWIPEIASEIVPKEEGRSPARAPDERAETAPVPEQSGGETYVVRPGDTLWSIADEQLGSGLRWWDLYQANRDRLSSPDRLPRGIELVLPTQ